VVHMDEGENRFNRPFIEDLHRVVDTIEAHVGPCAMVTTGSGKFYSNGLDLEWLRTNEDTSGFLESVHALFGRILGLDVYTVAAVNGHAFAGCAICWLRCTTPSSCAPTGATGAFPRSTWVSR
jgi:enoyl-CoA hydratase/carnithine racemase